MLNVLARRRAPIFAPPDEFMFIRSLEETPFSSLSYLNAAPGSRGTNVEELPFFRGRVDRLPAHLDALLCTSDLQGRRTSIEDGTSELLGVAVTEHLMKLADDGEIPNPARTGVILAGDLYADPAARVRGATGEVSKVWTRFADRFAFVTGVAGNHDTFDDRGWLERYPGVELLDGDVVDFDGLSIGGVGGIIGNKRKNERKDERAFIRMLEEVVLDGPDIIVLHQGPDHTDPRRRGHGGVRETIDLGPPRLTVFGHCHWPEPLLTCGAHQRLNVDARAVLLERV